MSLKTPVIKKRSNERFPIGFKFHTPDLEEGESIISAVALVSPTEVGGLEAVGSPTIESGDTVSQAVEGGIDGHDYYVRFTVTTSLNNVYEDSIFVSVRDITV